MSIVEIEQVFEIIHLAMLGRKPGRRNIPQPYLQLILIFAEKGD